MTVEGSRSSRRKRNAILGAVREFVIVVVLALLLATLIRVFLVQAFVIPSGSMQETLQIDDRVLVNKLTTRFGDVERGQVVVFEDPGGWLGPQDGGDPSAIESFLQFVGVMPNPSEGHLVKRVIGVGGDVVECCDAKGRLIINGESVDESQVIAPGQVPSVTEFEVVVPEGEYWMMGDNRGNSGDSRINGTVPSESIVGPVVAVAWPLDRWQWVDQPEVYTSVPATP